MTAPMTADELRDLAARTYRTCVERQARIAKRDEEARRAHTAILERCDEVERELRELRDDHIETLAHLVACVEVLGLPRDTDGPALVEAVRARALPRAEVRDADVVERSFYNQDRAAWSERAKRAESQLALAMAWGEELADAVRCEAAIEAARRRGYAESDRDTLDAMGEPHGTLVGVALVRYRERFAALMRERADERAETAERELEGAEREADEQRERRKRAEVERDAAHARAETAERELAETRADRDSWRQQCEDARSDALRYGCERDDLTAHARACLDPEIVSRDPAHARLAALVERIEGYRS